MNNARGIVLLVVLWAMLVLMTLAAEVARTMRIEGLTAAVHQEGVAAYYLATAGIHRALYQMVKAQARGVNAFSAPGPFGQQPGGESGGVPGQSSDEDLGVWVRGDGQWKSEELGAGGYWVRVSDEGGKVNLNIVDEPTLRQIFANLKFDVEISEVLTDTIQDWRDPDQLKRLHGAESELYLSLPVPYPAKDGPFDSPDELLLIEGVTPGLYYGREGPALREIFTVYNAPGGGGSGCSANLLTAGPLILQACLGLDGGLARDLVQRRSTVSGADLVNLIPGGASRGLNMGIPQIVTVDSIGYLNTSRVVRRISAVAQIIGVNGFRFLRWKDWEDGDDKPPPPAEG